MTSEQLERLHLLLNMAAYETRHSTFSRRIVQDALVEAMEIVEGTAGQLPRDWKRPLEKFR